MLKSEFNQIKLEKEEKNEVIKSQKEEINKLKTNLNLYIKELKPFFNELELLVNNKEQKSQSGQNITNESKNHSSSELYNQILQLEENAKRISNKSIKETQEAIQKSRLLANKNQVGEGKPTFITKKFTKNI